MSPIDLTDFLSPSGLFKAQCVFNLRSTYILVYKIIWVCQCFSVRETQNKWKKVVMGRSFWCFFPKKIRRVPPSTWREKRALSVQTEEWSSNVHMATYRSPMSIKNCFHNSTPLAEASDFSATLGHTSAIALARILATSSSDI